MRLATAVALLLLAVPLAGAQWPAFHGDSRNSGAVDGPYGLYEDTWWTLEAGARIDASLVVDDGVVVLADWSGVVRALDASTGKEQWRHEMADRVIGTPAIALGRVFVADEAGNLVGLDLRDGEVTAKAGVGATRGSITVHEGKLFIGNEAGQVKAYAASNLDLLWTFSVADVQDESTYNNVTGKTTCTAGRHTARPVRGAPAVYEGMVYFGSMNHHVYAVDEMGAPDGSTRVMWTYRTGDIVLASPAIDHERRQVVIGSYDERVHALPAAPALAGDDPCFGVVNTPAWVYQVPGDVDESKVHATAAIAEDRVFFGANNGHLYALEAATGAKAWEVETGGPMISSPAYSGGTLVVGSDDHRVRWLLAATGTVLAELDADAPVKSSPALLDGSTFFATDNGKAFRVGPPAPPRADLRLEGLQQTATGLQVDVVNVGGAASVPTVVRVGWAEATEEFEVPALAAKERYALEAAIEWPEGTTAVLVEADPERLVFDADRADNVAEDAFLVVPPEPETTTQVPVPIEPPPAQNVTGNGTSGGMTLWFIIGGVALVLIGGGVGFMVWRNRREEEDLEGLEELED